VSLIVRELRPEGWDRFGDYVCGRHPDALEEEMKHWMRVFPKLTVKDRTSVAFPQELEDYGREETDPNEPEVQVVGVRTRGARSKDPATDSERVGGDEEWVPQDQLRSK
jgi:hypothetical protein